MTPTPARSNDAEHRPGPAATTPEPITNGPHPAVDLVTERRAIVLSRRPVVGLSTWLADAVSRFTPTNRIVTLVTGPDARLTLPVRTLVAAGVMQWVVQTDHRSFYDGMLGSVLDYDDIDFVPDPARGRAEQFAAVEEPTCLQVLVSMTVEHRPTVHAELGGAVEAVARAFTGAPPRGWGLHEPVSEPWNRTELTAVARRRMPTETQLTVIGAGMIASVTAQRTDRGVEEHVVGLVDAGSPDRPIDEVRDISRRLLVEIGEQETVGFGWTHLRPGRRDLTEMGRVRALPIPITLLIGPRAVRGLGRQHLLAAPLPVPIEVGRPRVPGLCWSLGAEDIAAWDQLAALVRYLRPERILEVAPQLAQALGAGQVA